VETAYQRYWEVTTQAYFTLDTSRLPEVLAGEELSREERRVQQLAAQGVAGQLIYQHRLSFPEVSQSRALIVDELVNESHDIDPVTKVPLPSTRSPSDERIQVEMQVLEGGWKVVDVRVFR
jgi:hypothetical protein